MAEHGLGGKADEKPDRLPCRRLSAESGTSIAETSEVARYWVRTATEVSPRTLPLGSANWTNTRLLAGSNGTVPLPVAKMPKVGVVLGWMSVVTLAAGGAMHAPVAGTVWQALNVTGSVAAPTLALA